MEKLKLFLSDLKAYFSTIGENTNAGAKALKQQVGEDIRYVESVIEAFDKAAESAVETYQKAYAVQNTGKLENASPATVSENKQKNVQVKEEGENRDTGAETKTEEKLESSTEFAARVRNDGGTVVEADGRYYGFRRLDRGLHPVQRAWKVQKGLADLGVDAFRKEIKKSKSYRDDIFVLDILREEMSNDDPRIQRILFE